MPEEIWKIRVEAESNLAQLQAQIEQTRRQASQLSGGADRRTPMTFAQQDALKAAKDQTALAKAQEAAALSAMSNADKIKYLRSELAATAPGTLRYAEIQTQLNNTMNQGAQASQRYTQLFTKMAASMIVWEGMRAVIQLINETVEAQIRLSGEVARFGIITGESVDTAKQKYMELQGVMAQQGVAPSQGGDSLLRIARLTKNPAEQQEIAKVSAQMSQVLGIDVGTATEKLIAILEQEKRSGMEAGQVFDELIAIYKETGSSVDEIVGAMTEAAVIQDKWNTSSIETKGLIAELSQRANESAETVSGALIRVTNEIQGLEGQKLVDTSRMFREMGIEIQDTATGKLLPTLDILKNISAQFGNLSPDQQAKVYGAVGLEKPQYQQIGRELMSALADGIVGNLEIIRGAGAEAGAAFSESFQGAVNRLKASRELVSEKGSIGENIVATVLTGVTPILGKDSTQKAADLQMSAGGGFDAVGQNIKDEFLKSIANLSPDEQAQAIVDYEKRVRDAALREMQSVPFGEALGGLIGGQFLAAQNEQTFGYYDAAYQSTTDEVVKRARARMDELKKAGKMPATTEAATGFGDFLRQERGVNTTSATTQTSKTVSAPESIYTTEGELQNRLRNSPDYLGTSAVDMSKLSTDQFNMALRESEQVFYAIIDAQKREMELAGLTKEEINAKVKAMIEEAKLQEVLVEKAGKQYEYVRGIAAINLKDILGEDKFKPEKPENNFQFRRLKDVDPSQFPQLQALTQMYDQMLTNMGSPEKKSDINLLLGQQNVYKTMNARMTALQLALEDLTKVEKAQLSGTWNLPSGATALVPIQSLDIQRWNKSGGGGLSPEAIANIMGAMKDSQQPVTDATKSSGDKVSSSVDLARSAIVGAITQQPTRVTEKEGGKPLTSIIEQALGVKPLEDKTQPTQRSIIPPRRWGGEVTDDTGVPDPHPRETKTAELLTGLASTLAKPLAVTVSAMPLKANFNANLTVLMDGQAVAKAVFPILYQMLVKMGSATPSSGGTPGTVRN